MYVLDNNLQDLKFIFKIEGMMSDTCLSMDLQCAVSYWIGGGLDHQAV